MATIIGQLGLDYTFFLQFVLFAALFLILSATYFKPFMRLFELRHQRTVEDRLAAERMLAEAEQKFAHYQSSLLEAKQKAKQEFDRLVTEAKQQESEIISKSREQAKKIAQEATQNVATQKEKLKKELTAEVEQIATQIAAQLLKGKAI